MKKVNLNRFHSILLRIHERKIATELNIPFERLHNVATKKWKSAKLLNLLSQQYPVYYSLITSKKGAYHE